MDKGIYCMTYVSRNERKNPETNQKELETMVQKNWDLLC